MELFPLNLTFTMVSKHGRCSEFVWGKRYPLGDAGSLWKTVYVLSHGCGQKRARRRVLDSASRGAFMLMDMDQAKAVEFVGESLLGAPLGVYWSL